MTAPSAPEERLIAESVVVWISDLEVVLSQISHASGRYGLAVIRLQAALEAAHIDGSQEGS